MLGYFSFFFSFAFVFQPQCLDTLSLRGDVSVYVGFVPLVRLEVKAPLSLLYKETLVSILIILLNTM